MIEAPHFESSLRTDLQDRQAKLARLRASYNASRKLLGPPAHVDPYQIGLVMNRVMTHILKLRPAIRKGRA